MNGLSFGLTLGRQTAPPTPAAPSGLAVSIAEASLEFGDTATASVSVSGYPSPTLAYQWTLDAVDVDGQTGATFEGVPVGALRVRVTATNSEGSAGPVTSDPVTVVALAPGAFSSGQWNVDATGTSGEAAIIFYGLPPSNGAAITSVERAAGTLRQEWNSTTASQDWDPNFIEISPFCASHSPWNLATKPASTMDTTAVYGGVRGASLHVITSDLPVGDGNVAGAPFIMLGKHYNNLSPVNPFVQDALYGFRTDQVTELSATAVWTDLSADVDRSLLIAWQIYMSITRTQDDGWNEAGATFFDVQVRPSAAAGTNFPTMTGDASYTATISGVEWNIVRTVTTWQGADTRSYGFQPSGSQVVTAPNLKTIMDWIVANEIANFSQAETYLWLYSVQAWVEPRAGITDMIISDFTVTFNGTTYESIPAWSALAGVSLDTEYTVTGMPDDVSSDITLRAVNSIGTGPESDTKFVVSTGAQTPAQLGDNEWTFQPVPSSNDLEIVTLIPTGDETALSLEIDEVLKSNVALSDLLTGPVNLDIPTISGTAETGETLTATGGRWISLTGVTSSAWRWLRDDVAIGGATTSTYVLVGSDEGTDITAEETATDAQGASDPAVSAPLSIPTTAAAPNITAVTITGVVALGETMTANVTESTGVPAPTLAYQWKRDTVDISGATNATYILVAADSETGLTVTATATNASGSDAMTSSSTAIGVIVPALPPAPDYDGSLDGGFSTDADTTYDAGVAFSGADLVFSLTGTWPGSWTINADTGVITVPAGATSHSSGTITCTNDGGSVVTPTLAVTITGVAAPVYDDSLDAGVSLNAGETFDASTAFTGADIVYTLTGTWPTGWTINSSTGVVTAPSDATSHSSGTITATNAGGSDVTLAIPVTVVYGIDLVSGSPEAALSGQTQTDLGGGDWRVALNDPTGSNVNPRVRWAVALETGKTYRYDGNLLSEDVSGAVTARVNSVTALNGTSALQETLGAAGAFNYTFSVATTATHYVGVMGFSSTALQGLSITTPIIREVL